MGVGSDDVLLVVKLEVLELLIVVLCGTHEQLAGCLVLENTSRHLNELLALVELRELVDGKDLHRTTTSSRGCGLGWLERVRVEGHVSLGGKLLVLLVGKRVGVGLEAVTVRFLLVIQPLDAHLLESLLQVRGDGRRDARDVELDLRLTRLGRLGDLLRRSLCGLGLGLLGLFGLELLDVLLELGLLLLILVRNLALSALDLLEQLRELCLLLLKRRQLDRLGLILRVLASRGCDCGVGSDELVDLLDEGLLENLELLHECDGHSV